MSDRDLFEHPGFYLIAVRDDGTISYDDVHSTKAGVAQAKHLWDQLGFSARYASFRMMEVKQHPCPEPSAKGVNKRALDDCKTMLNTTKRA